MMNAIHMVAHRRELLEHGTACGIASRCVAFCIALLLNGRVAGVGHLAELQHGRTDGAADGAHRDGDRFEGQHHTNRTRSRTHARALEVAAWLGGVSYTTVAFF